MHITHFWCAVWKVFCFCAQYTFVMYHQERVLFLCNVHISAIPSGKCSDSVYSTYFCNTVWKVFCFCVHYTFLMYRLERFLFLCTVLISDVPLGKWSVSLHCTYFWCTVLKVFCFCAQYKILMPITVMCMYWISRSGFVLCCFVVMSPYWRQFQSLSNL